MKYIKRITITLAVAILVIIVTGMYKFNYLAHKKGYDSDGNKIKQLEGENRELGEKLDKLQENISDKMTYLKKRSLDLEREEIKIINSEDASGNKIKETLYSGTSDENPLREVSLSAREMWYSKFMGMSKNEIMKKYISFKNSDFENTGELKEQFDFDILLNNVLKRIGLQPHNGEHIESLINDLKKGMNNECIGKFCDNKQAQNQTTIHVPLVFGQGNIGCGVGMAFMSYMVPHTTGIMNATYEKLFSLPNQPLDEYRNVLTEYDQLHYQSLSLIHGVAKVYLTGNMYGPGHCSIPELRAQISQAALQFSTVNTVEVYLNGTIYDWCAIDESEGEGGCPANPQLWIDN